MSIKTAASLWLAKYKLVAIAGAAIALLGVGWSGGWYVQGLRARAAQAATAHDALAAVREAIAAGNAQHARDDAANTKLAADLAAQRRRYAGLQEDYRNAQNIFAAGVECSGNPFGPDFERLWNTSAAPGAVAGP